MGAFSAGTVSPAPARYVPPTDPSLSPAPSLGLAHSVSDSPAKDASRGIEKSAFQLQWEADQAKRLEEVKRRETERRKENQAAAQKQIKQFYEVREEKKRGQLQNLKAQERPPESAKGGSSWSKMSNLVDLSEKGRKGEKDTAKLRSILIDMKQAK